MCVVLYKPLAHPWEYSQSGGHNNIFLHENRPLFLEEKMSFVLSSRLVAFPWCARGLYYWRLSLRLDFFFSEPVPKLEPLGCYLDNSHDRAFSDMYASFRSQIIWTDMNHTIHQCAYLARSLGYQYFGIQNYGECWSGKDASKTYDKLGKAKEGDCWSGVGSGWRNFVYRLIWSESYSGTFIMILYLDYQWSDNETQWQ